MAPLKAIHVVSFAKRASPTMQRANQNASRDFDPTWPLAQDYPLAAILDMTRLELPQMWMDQKLGDVRDSHAPKFGAWPSIGPSCHRRIIHTLCF